jgi:hypothetical protein
MKRAQEIREWLAKQDGPRTTGQIATGIGKPGFIRVAHSVRSMFVDGYLVRERQGTAWMYRVGEPPKPRAKLSAEELRARKAERERGRNRRRGKRTRAEWQAEQAAKRAAREADAAAQRAARAAATAARAAQRAAAKAPAKPTHETGRRKAKVVTATTAERMRAEFVAAAAKAPRCESVAEWMARTGQRPEVLPLGAVSQPLRSISHREQNQMDWRNRKAA